MTEIRADAGRGADPRWRRLATRRRWVVAIAVVGAMAAGSLAFGLTGGGGSRPDATTIVRNGEVWLQGQITKDTCDMSETHLPIGDVGCSLIVNGYDVSVVQGNARLPGKPGTVTGLDVLKDQAGNHAAIYAQLTGPRSASILGAPKYYARISG